jgi:hypothetical protein
MAGTEVRAACGAGGDTAGLGAAWHPRGHGVFEAAHVYAFQIAFVLMGIVALVDAAVC